MTVIWEEPPRRNHRQQLADLCQQLREKPGEWARLDVFPTLKVAQITASQLRTGKVEGITKGDFEFTSHKLEDGTAAIWGRFLA